jgi:uncharacterized protein YidB (DUF937 family)
MGLLDAILKQAESSMAGAPAGSMGSGSGASAFGSIADLVMKNPQVISAAIAMLNPKDPTVGGGSGLSDIVAGFNRSGLGDVMASWIGGGPNKPVDPSALKDVLGSDVLSQFAKQAGIGHGDASSVLAQILPEIVNHMTPQGRVPTGNALEGAIGSLLGELGTR